MLTVIIPYTNNEPGLAQLLVSIQPQLHPEDDIYILDMSKDRSGVKMAKTYGSSRCYIFVETFNKDTITEDAIAFGFQSMKENKQEGALIIEPNIIIPVTFIANLKKAIKLGHDVLFFKQSITPKDERMDANFKWFTPPPHLSPLRNIYLRNIKCAYVHASIVNEGTSNIGATNPGYIDSELIVLTDY